MSAEAYAVPSGAAGVALPRLGSPAATRSVFGDLMLVLFLLAQCLDGVFTYVGVVTFGASIEANPIIAALMAAFGDGPALAGAKILASLLGICLHLREVHGAVAALTAFYAVAAIAPWTAILFFPGIR